jgi:hypothetical protein
MNIEDAKGIPLSLIFEKLNALPTKQTEKDAWYLSPWRDERTASLHVNLKTNQWYDHGDGIGGDTVNLVCQVLKAGREDCTVADALRWLRNMSYVPMTFAIPQAIKEEQPHWTLVRVGELEDFALTRYLAARGISLSIAKELVCEAYVRNPKNQKLYAIGFKNEEGGYELRNKYFKSCIAPKTITFIRGTNSKPGGIHLFEGFMDFLSVVTINKGRFKDDSIILNSLSCIGPATSYIKGYGYRFVYTWMDNDKAGNKATSLLSEFFKTEADLQHRPMNKIYKAHKDVNAWHMHNHNLVL